MGEIQGFYINFLHQPLEDYQKFKVLPTPGAGVGFLLHTFDHVLSLHLAKGANTVIADLNAIDVGINEMFRRLKAGA